MQVLVKLNILQARTNQFASVEQLKNLHGNAKTIKGTSRLIHPILFLI